MTEPDRIFLGVEPGAGEFRFDERVAKVFPDMLRRSIPGYPTLLQMIGVMAAQYAQSGTRLYDLGCSLGAATLALRHAVASRDVEIIGVDNSEAMVAQCQELMRADAGACPVEIRCEDVVGTEISNASVVVLNFTLQFVDADKRDALIERIAHGLRPGGILILSEKVIDSDPGLEQWQAELHDAFRQSNHYSKLEIARKRTALEKVLVPETAESHEARLGAYFKHVAPWYRCLNFRSWVAITKAEG